MASSLGIDGLASGLKTTDLINAMMETEKKPLTMLEDEKTTVKAKSDAWREINSKFLTMRNTVSSLRSTLTFKGREATVSDSEIMGADATTGATTGTYKVEVLKMAQAQTITSGDAQTSASTSSLSGKPMRSAISSKG